MANFILTCIKRHIHPHPPPTPTPHVLSTFCDWAVTEPKSYFFCDCFFKHGLSTCRPCTTKTKQIWQVHQLYAYCLNTISAHKELTHWGRDKMAAIFQTTFSEAFSWKKIYNFCIKISLKFVPKGPSSKIPALVQMMAWHRPGDKSLYELTMVRFLAHICVTRPQWVNHESAPWQ